MRPYAFGADVGGTTVKIGMARTDGTLLDKWQIPTRTEEHGRYILTDILDAVRERIKLNGISWQDVEGVGFGVPGPVTEDGTVIKCVNLGWDVFNLQDTVQHLEPGIHKCRVTNDVNAAALGEIWKGGASDYRSAIMVALGTGVGCGVVVNEQILTGARGAAGEFGHFCVDFDETETCNCGLRGCLEQYCSANGLVRCARRMLAQRPDEETCLRDVAQLTSKDVCDAAREGDRMALTLVDQLGRRLGWALTAAAGTINPEVIVIGGGLSNAGMILLEPIMTHFRAHAFHAFRDTPFALAKLGNDAGMYGCVRMLL